MITCEYHPPRRGLISARPFLKTLFEINQLPVPGVNPGLP